MTHPTPASNINSADQATEANDRSLYVYFVAFAHGVDTIRFGNAEIKRSTPITRFEAVSALQAQLEASGGLQQVVIHNYVLLRVDEA